MKESWKDITGLEGRYQVSNLGRIKSLDRIVNNGSGIWNRRGSILRPQKRKGYLSINLPAGEIFKTKSIHRLVALAFIPNPLNLLEINHKDGIKENNHIDNLEWITSSENSKHAYKIGLCVAPYLGKFGKDHNTSKQIFQFDKSMAPINTFESMSLARIITGISHVDACARGERKTAGGYIWKYINT